MIAHPAAGRRILVTRVLEDAERWAARLSTLGATPVVLPCLVCEPLAREGTADALRAAMAGARWLLVASPRGAMVTGSLLDGALPRGVQVAAVGEATARAAVEHLGRVDLVATESTSLGAGRELAARMARDGDARSGRVVVAGAAGGRDDAESVLRDQGISVQRIDVYRTIPVPPASPKRDLASEHVDDVLLASPSAVTGLLNAAEVPAGARVITIGPTTSAAARAAGLAVSAEAARPSLEGMLEVMS